LPLRAIAWSLPFLLAGLLLLGLYLPDRLAFSGELVRVSGKVTATSAGGSKAIRKHRVSFEYLAGGELRHATSHGDSTLPVGAIVDVEHVAGDPSRARVVGMHDDGGSGWLAVVLGGLLLGVAAWVAYVRLFVPPAPASPLPPSPGSRSSRKRKPRRGDLG
jgi:hypothetical protein